MHAMAWSTPLADVREHRLDNGLTVLVRADHTAPLASVWCWYRVGSRDEGPGLTGASHWCEHMNFKGTTRIPRDRVKGLVEPYGGFWNGYTWIDLTAYVETAAASALDHLLFIEAERMGGCLYHPDDCASERTVIISELEGAETDPDQLLDREVVATALTTHPYRHPVLGWIDDLRTMTRDDLVGHYRRHYHPGNATLVVVGDVDPDAALARVRHHFDHLEPGAASASVRPVEPEQRAERRVVVPRDGGTAYLKVAWPAPAVGNPDFFPMLVLDAVLTGAKGLSLWASFRTAPPQRRARLCRALVDGGLASSVQGLLVPTAEPFLYIVSVTVADGASIADAEARLHDEVARVARDGVTSGELAVAANQLRARLVFDADGVTNLGHQLGYFETVASWRTFGDLLPRIAAVTREDVHRVAATRLAPHRRTVGWFDPSSSGRRPSR